MNVVVTGGAGFLGSHLCEALLAQGHQVMAIDNLISGQQENIKGLLSNPNFTFVNHDLTQPLDIEGPISSIFHFASPASPNPDSPVSYAAHPIETLLVNSLGTQHMLELAKRDGAQIILASTSEVYGEPSVHPQPETYWGNVSSTGIRSCYDEAKRFMEAISFAYYRKHAVKIKVIRIFNTYGPRMRLDDGRFIPNLMKSYLEGTPLTIFGEGENTRSFCYVDDLISGIMAVAGSDRAIGEVINLGNPEEFSIKRCIELFGQITGKPLALVSKPPLSDDPTRRCPDIAKAKAILGWSPKIPLADGLRKTLAFFQETR